jgi:hypothetical protein
MVSKRLQNIIFNKYVDSHRCILEQIRSQKFWNTCNTDEMGEILFFSNPTEFISGFNWGNIELNKFRESWSLLSHEILYLIPLPPAFRVNQLQEHGYPEPLYGYQPIPIERSEWTLDFSRIIDSWLMAAIIYDANLLSKQDRLNLIANINAHPTLFDVCQSLQFSEDDSKIKWNKLPEAISNEESEFYNHRESLLSLNLSIDILQIPDVYIRWQKVLVKALRSWDIWNTSNTYERGNYLFFNMPLYSNNTEWQLIDVSDNETEFHILGVLPGLIQLPYPPSHKSTATPVINYQPTVEERYDWTLEFARRLDAWLAAIILYAVSLYQQEDKLQVFNIINSMDSISDVCIDWEFDQHECQLNWE